MTSPPMPEIGVKHLNAVVALARFGNFIAAASHLGISQPGLSRIIQQAERKLGVPLFERRARTVSLTAAGRDFLPFAERVLGEFAQHVEKLRTSLAASGEQLVVSSLMSISHLVLPLALVDFRRTHPHVFVEVREGVGSTVTEWVREGVVDFGIGNPDEKAPGVSTESVLEEAFFVVLPRGHPLARRDIVNLSDLRGVPLVSMPVESGLRRLTDAAAEAAGLGLSHSIVTNQYSSLFGFVASGLGATIVPASTLPPLDDAQFVVRALTPTITRRIGVIRPATRSLTAASEAFLHVLRPLLMAATEGSRQFSYLTPAAPGETQPG